MPLHFIYFVDEMVTINYGIFFFLHHKFHKLQFVTITLATKNFTNATSEIGDLIFRIKGSFIHVIIWTQQI